MLSWGIIIAIVVILLFVLLLLTLGEGLLKLSAKQAGVEEADYSVIPTSLRGILGRSRTKPVYVPENERLIALNKGFTINLLGGASVGDDGIPSLRIARYALNPKDFIGLAPIPKVQVNEGDTVKAGDPLFMDKSLPGVVFAAPVSGQFIELNRGEKRSIEDLVILADQEDMQYRSYELPNLETVAKEDLIEFLKGSGFWPFLRQRPHNIVADPTQSPKGIFISTFSTAPLAPDYNIVVEGEAEAFQKGLDVLSKLVDGKVHLGLDANGLKAPSAVFTEAQGVKKHWFKGQHPSGNVGVQIHHIDPIASGDTVWTLSVQAVLILGRLFTKGIFDTEQVVALTGAELPNPAYVRIHQGAAVQYLLEDVEADIEQVEDWVKESYDTGKKDKSGKPIFSDKNVKKTVQIRKFRIISGNALVGKQIDREGYIGFFDEQITTIKEGDYYEIFGWLIPQKGRPTASRTFPAGFFPDTQYEADTNTNGEKRAFVVSGQYEEVLPMDIHVQHLFRAIQANDFERMEGLGLYELVEEDVAICEYVCTSKQPLQQMLREGLDTVRLQA